MSDQDDSGRVKVEVPIPAATYGNVQTRHDVSAATTITATFTPERDWTYGPNNEYTSTIPADVTVHIGGAYIAFEPHVWAVVITAVQALLPQQSPAIQGRLRAVVADQISAEAEANAIVAESPVLANYLACEGVEVTR